MSLSKTTPNLQVILTFSAVFRSILCILPPPCHTREGGYPADYKDSGFATDIGIPDVKTCSACPRG